MAHEAYDPRDDVREKIGTNLYNFELEQEYYAIQITNSFGETVNIPIYDREKVLSREQPKLPYVSMALVKVYNDPHNIGATVRKFTAYVDLDVVYTAMENIDLSDFAKKIKDELHDKIRTYQATTNDVFFMNIESERYLDTNEPRQVIFHYILTLKCEHHDAC